MVCLGLKKVNQSLQQIKSPDYKTSTLNAFNGLVNTGSGNGLAPNRQQAITWTKFSDAKWRH